MLQMNPNQVLPEVIRVRALKGFRAHVDGRFGIVNPGDVVEVTKEVAVDLRMGQKAVMTDAALHRDKNYMPEHKRQKARPVSEKTA